MESVIGKRIDGIVGGKYRNKYNDVALLVALLGDVKSRWAQKWQKGLL